MQYLCREHLQNADLGEGGSGQVPDGRKFDQQLLTPSDIGGLNRSRVLQALCDHGPLSRADLAKMAGVTRATMGNIVNSLIDAGLVEEGAPAEGTGRVGKPARPLWFGPRAGLSGAVVVGRGVFQAALVNARGDLLESQEGTFDPDEASGEPVTKSIAGGLGRVVPRRADSLLGIGVAVPGLVDVATGTVLGSGQVPGLQGRKLFKAIADRFPRRVIIDNDSRAQALGEKWFGKGRGLGTFASIQTGHGLGVGMVIGGTVYRGRHGEAGEAGHMSVAAGGDTCRCGLRGCWETIASLDWVRSQAQTRGIPDAGSVDTASLVALAESGSNEADRLLEDYADNIAVGLANLTMVLTPGYFILHGDAVGGGERFRRLIEEKTKSRVFPNMAARLEVVLSELDQRAGLLGAAGLVLSETFHLSI